LEQNANLFRQQEAIIAAKCFKDPKDPKGGCNVSQEATNKNLNIQRQKLGLPPLSCGCNKNWFGVAVAGVGAAIIAGWYYVANNAPQVIQTAEQCAAASGL
jgi:hypothetical protein